MTTTAITTNTVGAGVRVTTAVNTPIYVLQGVTVLSTDADAINGNFDVDITIAGSVVGNSNAINMGQAGGSSSIVVTPTGLISGTSNEGIQFFNGSLTVTNYGTITAWNDAISYATTGSNDFFLLTNYGNIAGTGHGSGDAIFVTNAARATVYNFGSIGSSDAFADASSVAYNGCSNSDTVFNYGTMFGVVYLNSGNDFYDGRSGITLGAVDGGAGDDVLLGSADSDTFVDTTGNNWIVGGGGDDSITIANFGLSNGVSTVYGGEVNGADTSGNDTLAFTGLATNVFLGGGAVTDVTTGNVLAWINGFENVTGTNLGDALIGSNGNNIIQGGFGADWLVGNGGADTFRYAASNDAALGETIADFNHVQGDIVDLSRIDADTGTAGDQAFAYVTSHTNNAAGQMVLSNFGSGARIDLYTNADNTIDGTIFVAYGAATTTNILAGDFIL